MKTVTKFVSILLSLVLIFSLFTIIPVSAGAATFSVKYIDENGVEQTAHNVTEITEQTYYVKEGGWYMVDSSFFHDNNDVEFICIGDVHLILCDGCKFEMNSFLSVRGSLTIYGQKKGTGKLITGLKYSDGSHLPEYERYNNKGSAGIGGEGTLTINGGTITAFGGKKAAGIGDSYSNDFGDIIINGGTVNATGGEGAAGIGSDYMNYRSTVTINGGTVNATGGEGGFGIGGNSNYSNTTINGGTVSASGTNGMKGNVTLSLTDESDSVYSSSYSGSVTLTNNLKDQNNNAYFIGGVNPAALSETRLVPFNPDDYVFYVGADGKTKGTNNYKELTEEDFVSIPDQFSGGTRYILPAENAEFYVVSDNTTINNRVTCFEDVKLILCDNAVLDLPKGFSVRDGDSLTIFGQQGGTGELRISEGYYQCAGIGGENNADSGPITINGGVIYAQGGEGGAGIGGGASHAGNVTINGGTVNATGGENSAGIGGGTGSRGNVRINGGIVNATGSNNSAGIGGSRNANASDIQLSWTKMSDRITANTYNNDVTLLKPFTDGTNNYKPGRVSYSSISGKTLAPAQSYTVTWKNDDGTVLETDPYLFSGETPAYNGATPTKESTAQYSYEFAGWTPEPTAVTKDATYTATYTAKERSYTVTWKNGEDVLEVDENVLYGTTPSYNGVTPTKESTAQYNYEFSGWTPQPAAVTKDATYTATYTANVRSYTVTWKNGEDVLEVDENVPYGTTPSYNGATPTKAPDTDGAYLFAGWSPAISSVTGDVTYTAKFEPKSYIPMVEPYIDENGAYILGTKAHFEINGKNYAVTENGGIGEELSDLSLSYFEFSPLGDGSYQIDFYTGPTENLSELVIPKTYKGDLITVLGNNNFDYNNANCRLLPTGTPSFTLVLNENITKITAYTFYATNIAKVTGDTSGLNVLGASAFSWANGGNDYSLDIRLDYPGSIKVYDDVFNHMNVTARIKHTTTFSKTYFGEQSINYIYTDEHTITLPETNPGGSVTAETLRLFTGDTATLTVTPDDGYEIESVTVTKDTDSAETVAVTQGTGDDADKWTFTMPDSDVTVSAIFKLPDISVDDGIPYGEPGHYYVNMPQTGTKTLTLPNANVTAFKVYDDGGKNGKYSNECDGYLILTAPEGYLLALSGNITTENQYDYLTVYDGSDTNAAKLLNEATSSVTNRQTAIGTVLSSGRSITINFNSDSSDNYSGLDLTVTLINDSTEYDITVLTAAGGSAVCDKATAHTGETVTLTASPDTGYILADVSVADENGNAVPIDWKPWSNTLTFTMPFYPVTVTPVFTDNLTVDGGVYLNLPVTGTKEVTIPQGMQSFKVYDDGGKNGNYSNNCNGALILTAPEGYMLELSGSVTAENYTYDYLTVYDNDEASGAELIYKMSSSSGGVQTAIETVLSSGRSMTIFFHSDNMRSFAGLDLTVKLINVNAEYDITVLTVAGGSAVCDKAAARAGDTVTLTATPDTGFILADVSVVDVNAKAVPTDWNTWSNTLTFIMPFYPVTVTPFFTDDLTVDGGVYLNLPVTGTKEVTIPQGMQSFKVYDDGGKSNDYSNNCDGALILTAPEGYVLELSGSLTTEIDFDYLIVYDNNEANGAKLLDKTLSPSNGVQTPIETVRSSGRSMTLFFRSDRNTCYAGLDLNVTLRPIFSGHSLTLNGAIGVNYYLDLTDRDIANGATVDFEWMVEGNKKTHSVTLTADDKTDNGYKAACPIAVAEMTYDITATLNVGGEQIATDTYSAVQYADVILSDGDFKTSYIATNGQEKYDSLTMLVKTMLGYGAKAQIQFSRDTENLADKKLTSADPESAYYYAPETVTADMISANGSDMYAGLESFGLAYKGSTIVYLTETSIRHYYEITDQAAFDAIKENITFGSDTPVGYTVRGDEIFFEKKNVAAPDLDTPYTLSFNGTEYQYSVMDYVKACLLSDKVSDSTKALVAATYLYNQAANTYFGR